MGKDKINRETFRKRRQSRPGVGGESPEGGQDSVVWVYGFTGEAHWRKSIFKDGQGHTIFIDRDTTSWYFITTISEAGTGVFVVPTVPPGAK